MTEFFHHIPAGMITPDMLISPVEDMSPDHLIRLAKHVSHLVCTDELNPVDILAGVFDYLEQSARLPDQAK